MTDQPVSMPSQLETAREIDRIRDIIFGSQMRDYTQRFQVLKRDIDRLQQEIDRLTEQLAEQDQGQDKKVQTLRQEMRQSNNDLREELRQTAERLLAEKVDRISLGEALVDLGTQLKTGVSAADLLAGLGDRVDAG